MITKLDFKGHWGMLLSIDLKDCNPSLIRSANALKRYAIELCDLIKMKRYGDTQLVHFGDDDKVCGYSMLQLIETSLVSGHFAESTNSAYIDIFSCKFFDPQITTEFTSDFFETTDITTSVLMRK